MKKISSGNTFFAKKVFPAIWFGFLVFILATVLMSGIWMKVPFILIVPCLMTVFGYFLFKKLVWVLADEVHDCGEYLLVKKGREEERVMLTNVMNVSAPIFINPKQITLRLIEPGKFGDEIVFSPVFKFSLNPFVRNDVAEDLIVRVDQARAKRFKTTAT
jgi:hypothetical protein